VENQVVELKTTLSVFNFESLREELNEKMKLYKGVVVSENNFDFAKGQRAELNNMKKTIEDARKAVKKEVMKWYDAEFEPQCKSLVAIIDEVVKDIDGGIKATEEAKRQEKQALINDTWSALGFTLVKLEQIQGSDWLNKTKSLASIKEEMQKTINGINQDLQIIERFPNDTDTLKARYLMTLDLATVLAQYDAEQQLKAKVNGHSEPIKEEPKSEEIDPFMSIELRVVAPKSKLKYLGKWLRENGYQFIDIGEGLQPVNPNAN